MADRKQFRLGLVGYGEIGSTLGAGLRGAGLESVACYDKYAFDGPYADLIQTRAREAGVTLVRSRDRGLAVSIAADYGQEGETLAPGRYAAATLRALRGYRRLRLGSARPVRGTRFAAASVTTTGVYAPTGVRQAIRAIALQRRGVVTFSLLVFRNVRVAERVYRRALDEIVRTFRAEPPGP